MGKTFNCRKFAHDISKLAGTQEQIPFADISNPRESIPRAIYIDLRDIDTFIINSEGNTIIPPLESMLSQILKSRGSIESPEDIIPDVRDGDATIIFDGLDEKIVHYTKEMESKFLSELMRILPPHDTKTKESKGGAKIVLSCRTHHFEDIYAQDGFFRELDRGVRAQKYEALSILPFDSVQIASFLTKALPRAEAKEAIGFIESKEYLQEIVSRPYLLDKVSGSIGSIVELSKSGEMLNSASLYHTIIQDTLIRDEEKHSIPRRIKMELLSTLAYDMWSDNRQRLSVDDLNEWLHEWIGENPKRSVRDLGGDNIKWRELEIDLRNTTLLIRFGEDDFGFSHSSMQEYFLARYIYTESIKKPTLGLHKRPSKLTVKFLLDMVATSRDSHKLHGWIEHTLQSSYDSASLIALEMLSEGIEGMAPVDCIRLEGADLRAKHFAHIKARDVYFAGTVMSDSRWEQCEFETIHSDNNCFNESIWIECKWSKREFTNQKDEHLKHITAYKSDIVTVSPTHPPLKSIDIARPRLELPHSGSIASLVIMDEWIVSGSDDNSIKIWDREGSCLRTLEGHSGTVASLAIMDEWIVSGSDDETVKIWDREGNCLRTLEGHSK